MSSDAPTRRGLVRHGKTPDCILRMRWRRRKVSSRKETCPGQLHKNLSGCRVEHRFKRSSKRQKTHVGTIGSGERWWASPPRVGRKGMKRSPVWGSHGRETREGFPLPRKQT